MILYLIRGIIFFVVHLMLFVHRTKSNILSVNFCDFSESHDCL